MSENTRKSVVTIAQVQSAMADYQSIQTAMGRDAAGHTFDKGIRGKGFAQYDANDTIVRTFDSKEDALTFYSRYVDVAREVMEAFNLNPDAEDVQEDTSGQEGESESVAQEAVPTQRRRRVAAVK